MPFSQSQTDAVTAKLSNEFSRHNEFVAAATTAGPDPFPNGAFTAPSLDADPGQLAAGNVYGAEWGGQQQQQGGLLGGGLSSLGTLPCWAVALPPSTSATCAGLGKSCVAPAAKQALATLPAKMTPQKPPRREGLGGLAGLGVEPEPHGAERGGRSASKPAALSLSKQRCGPYLPFQTQGRTLDISSSALPSIDQEGTLGCLDLRPAAATCAQRTIPAPQQPIPLPLAGRQPQMSQTAPKHNSKRCKKHIPSKRNIEEVLHLPIIEAAAELSVW
jgi:hypothetical protein